MNLESSGMMDVFLKENNLVDLKGLALLRYKELGLSDQEILILLVMITLQDASQNVLSQNILMKYTHLSPQDFDNVLMGLINKGMIHVIGTNISLDSFYKKLFFDKTPVKEEAVEGINLVSAFENEFAKALTPMELETIKTWKQSGYSDKMIIDALKEAALSNVHSFRYIEKILINWAQHGVRRSNQEPIENIEDDEEFVEYKWWEEND